MWSDYLYPALSAFVFVFAVVAIGRAINRAANALEEINKTLHALNTHGVHVREYPGSRIDQGLLLYLERKS